MGWKTYYKDTLEKVEEGTVGRPMQDGEDGKLLIIAHEDYHHRVAVDLRNGVFIIDYDSIEVVDNALQIKGAKSYLSICDETNIVGDLKELVKSEPDKSGWYSQAFKDLVWRPIWFTRHINTPVSAQLVYCIGAQTTLPEEFGGKNVKAFISLFADGRVGLTDGVYTLGGEINGVDNITETNES